jgi:hypothetical protein
LKVIDTETHFRIIHEPKYLKGFIALLIGIPMMLYPVSKLWDNALRELLKGWGILIPLVGLIIAYRGIRITVYRSKWDFNKTEKILTHQSGHKKKTYHFSELQKVRYSEVPSDSFFASVGGGAIEIICKNGSSLDVVVCEDRKITRQLASQLGSIVKDSAE